MKTDIDKTVTKIKKLLKIHNDYGEFLELAKITDRACNLYLVGRINNTVYEQKHIATITSKERLLWVNICMTS